MATESKVYGVEYGSENSLTVTALVGAWAGTTTSKAIYSYESSTNTMMLHCFLKSTSAASFGGINELQLQITLPNSYTHTLGTSALVPGSLISDVAGPIPIDGAIIRTDSADDDKITISTFNTSSYVGVEVIIHFSVALN